MHVVVNDCLARHGGSGLGQAGWSDVDGQFIRHVGSGITMVRLGFARVVLAMRGHGHGSSSVG